MIKQAVQTLTGRGGVSAEDSDPYYLSEDGAYEPQTQNSEDGPEDNQDGLGELRSTVDRLSQDYETLTQRLSDKDRYIGRLEQENYQYRSGAYQPDAGWQPEQEPDPVLDEETASLFAEKYKEDPAKALVAIADHMDRRNRSHADTEIRKRDMVQQAMANLQAAERNILRQVDLASNQLGPVADDIIGDFLDVVRSGNGSSEDFARTWLGQQIQQDQTLAKSPQGVYRLIELEALRRQGNTQEQGQEAPRQAQPRQQSSSVMRPSAPHRSVSQPSDGSEDGPSVEDRIADAIVNSQHGDDAQVRQLFHG